MNIVFLDVNGVLDSFENNEKQRDKERHYFDWQCIYQLYRLVESTDSKIVVTSEWRHSKKNMKRLMLALSFTGLDQKVIGSTPRVEIKKGCFSKIDRGEEIKTYLENHEWDNYVILDDTAWDLEPFGEHFVWTHPRYGLTEKDVEKAKKVLRGKTEKVFQK